jgi:tRNA pseudouridine32 synthase / 23S rRNA pseudouridine746 synthase
MSTAPSLPYQPPSDAGNDILYADTCLVAVNKPSGLLSVPGRGADKQDCLLSRLARQFPDVLAVHRLDMDTSGVLVLARNKMAHGELSRQFRQREVEKRYLAVVAGQLMQPAGEINLPLICDWPNRPRQKIDFDVGKPSLTTYRRLGIDAKTDSSRVELYPVTGRSHQLRVHLAAIGHPILGDDLYAGEAFGRAPRLLLHATFLAITHPETGLRLHFDCPPPF